MGIEEFAIGHDALFNSSPYRPGRCFSFMLKSSTVQDLSFGRVTPDDVSFDHLFNVRTSSYIGIAISDTSPLSLAFFRLSRCSDEEMSGFRKDIYKCSHSRILTRN